MYYMIQITAYLRNEDDHAKWKLVTNKTEFLHLALSGTIEPAARPAEPTFAPRKTCKNGHNLDKFGFNCSEKDCKYGK